MKRLPALVSVSRIDWPRLAPRLLQQGWRLLLVGAALALLAGLVYPATRTSIPEDPLLQSFDCASPPCFPQTPGSRLGDLLVRLPPFAFAAALILFLPALFVSSARMPVVRSRSAAMKGAGPAVVLVLGTLLILVAGEIVPHLLNPCLAAGPSLSGLCGEFAGRWDVQDRWHPLLHAVLGTVPLTLLVALSGYRAGSLRRQTSG